MALQVADDVEQIARLRIAGGSEHADQALRRRTSVRAQLPKADRRVDVVAQDRLAAVHVATEQGFDALTQQRLAEGRIGQHARLYRVLEIACQRHGSPRLSLAPLVVRPARPGRFDVALLPPFGAAGQQDDQRLAVASEIHPVAGSEIKLVFQHPFPDALDVNLPAQSWVIDAWHQTGCGLSRRAQ